jgi:hypothetical protein
VTAAQTAERSRVPAEGLQIGQLHDESEFAAPGLPQPQVTNWDRPTLLPRSGGASDQQVIEEYTQRARDASGGNDPTAPLFRWAAGIDSHQKQELLAVIDGLHLSNRALQEQLHKAESLALLAQQAATDGMGDGGRANPKSPPDSFSAGSRHTSPERDDVAHLVSMNQKLSLQLAGMEANADRGSSGGGGGGGGTFASGGGRGGAVASKGEEAARSKQAPQYIHADVDNVFTDREVSPPFNSGVGAGVGAGAAGAAGAGAYQHASQSVQSGRMEELVGQVNL